LLLRAPRVPYYAASDRAREPARSLLFQLMARDQAPVLTSELLGEWTGSEDEGTTLELLWRMQSVGWLQGPLTAARRRKGRSIRSC
jgi:hypothetical protein